jgi:uncharacterized protein YjbI with pentapeptide repeats
MGDNSGSHLRKSNLIVLRGNGHALFDCIILYLIDCIILYLKLLRVCSTMPCVLEIEVMTAEELLRRYEAGERDFSGVDLYGITLEEVELPDIRLNGANLYGVTLSDVDLRSADLSNAILEGSQLRGVDLSGANLSGCRLSDSAMEYVDLSNANLTDARLYETGLANVDLTNACLFGSMFGDNFSLVEANLTNVNLSIARIHIPLGVNNPRLRGAIFCNTTMPDGSVYNSNCP